MKLSISALLLSSLLLSNSGFAANNTPPPPPHLPSWDSTRPVEPSLLNKIQSTLTGITRSFQKLESPQSAYRNKLQPNNTLEQRKRGYAQ